VKYYIIIIELNFEYFFNWLSTESIVFIFFFENSKIPKIIALIQGIVIIS